MNWPRRVPAARGGLCQTGGAIQSGAAGGVIGGGGGSKNWPGRDCRSESTRRVRPILTGAVASDAGTAKIRPRRRGALFWVRALRSGAGMNGSVATGLKIRPRRGAPVAAGRDWPISAGT
jgi:hypothetical protein